MVPPKWLVYNGLQWFTMENPVKIQLKMDDLGLALFFGNLHLDWKPASSDFNDKKVIAMVKRPPSQEKAMPQFPRTSLSQLRHSLLFLVGYRSQVLSSGSIFVSRPNGVLPIWSLQTIYVILCFSSICQHMPAFFCQMSLVCDLGDGLVKKLKTYVSGIEKGNLGRRSWCLGLFGHSEIPNLQVNHCSQQTLGLDGDSTMLSCHATQWSHCAYVSYY